MIINDGYFIASKYMKPTCLLTTLLQWQTMKASANNSVCTSAVWLPWSTLFGLFVCLFVFLQHYL